MKCAESAFKKHFKKRYGMTYTSYLKSTWWKKTRKLKLQATQYKCELCGEPAKVVHHKKYNIFEEAIADLLAVCHRCHQVLHPKASKQWVALNEFTADTTLLQESVDLENEFWSGWHDDYVQELCHTLDKDENNVV